jgi:hypothetical protein
VEGLKGERGEEEECVNCELSKRRAYNNTDKRKYIGDVCVTNAMQCIREKLWFPDLMVIAGSVVTLRRKLPKVYWEAAHRQWEAESSCRESHNRWEIGEYDDAGRIV